MKLFYLYWAGCPYGGTEQVCTFLIIQPGVSRSRSSLVVESLSLMREAWVQSSAAPTKALEQGLNLHLLLGPYLDGAPACLN